MNKETLEKWLDHMHLLDTLYNEGSLNLGKFVIQQSRLSYEIIRLFVTKHKESTKKLENQTLGTLIGQLKVFLKCKENSQIVPNLENMLDNYNSQRNKIIHKMFTMNFIMEINDLEIYLEEVLYNGENIKKDIKVLRGELI